MTSLFTGFEACPERVAFEAEGVGLTYGELDRRSRGWAAWLAGQGVRPGDRVAVLAESSLDLVVAIAGSLRSGVVHVPVNTRYREAELRHVVEDSGAKLLVTAEELARRPRGDLPAPSPPARDALAMLIYTSGTTGRAKGVALSHAALAANLGATTRLWRWTERDRLALALPLFHVHGLGLGVLGTLLQRMTAELHPRFEPAAVVDAFARGATIFMGVPTMYARLLAHLEAHPDDAAHLGRGRLFTSGSAALPAAHHEAFTARTGHRIVERYGMSETGFTLSNPHDGERRAGTVGRPVPGYEVRVVRDDGSDCDPGEQGEIVVRGDGLLDAYWNLPEATAAAFRDGWFLTGDVAVVESGGYHRIVGRRSVDILKSGGFKISAREIEDVLLDHPRVAEVAVIGLPDPEWGEAIAAGIVPIGPVPDAEELRRELAAFVSARLADYKKPRRLLLLDELPRNALGKVQKHALRDAHQSPGSNARRPRG